VFWLVFSSLCIFCAEFFWLLQGRLLIPVQQIVCEGFCPKCECLTHIQSRDLHEKNVAALCGYGTNLWEQEWHEICGSGCRSCSNATVKSQFVLLGPVLPTFTQNPLEELWHHHTNKVAFLFKSSLPSSRQHHLSNDDCPEDKREGYKNCSVLHCVRQLCTVICAHIWTVLKVDCWFRFFFFPALFASVVLD